MRNDCRPWTTADDAYLTDNYLRRTDESIGKSLDRTTVAVKMRREKLDLYKQGSRKSKGVALLDYTERYTPNPQNMTSISTLACRAEACGMTYGPYIGATPEARRRARAEMRERSKERNINPWAIAVRV